jgi:hypothetical protein
MREEPVNVFLIGCYRSHKKKHQTKRVGIDSIAAAGGEMLLVRYKVYMREETQN